MNVAPFACLGSLEVRLAANEAEVALSQNLRYQVFYEEMDAVPTPEMWATRRDVDTFDPICDHLLVIDKARPAAEAVVGTYRLLRQELAEAHGGFYSAAEYDIAPLFRHAAPASRFLELGRSCVHPSYRNNSTIQLLWRGITAYTARHRLTVMFGCASLPGTDPDALAMPLSFLAYEFQAPEGWRVRAQEARYVEMKRLPREAVDARAALRALPPLIKGYLRLGAYIGEGAVVDRQFGTTDVFILLPIARIGERYYGRFDRASAEDDRLARLRLAGVPG